MSCLQQALNYLGFTSTAAKAALFHVFFLTGALDVPQAVNWSNDEAVVELVQQNHDKFETMDAAIKWLNETGQGLRKRLLSEDKSISEIADMEELPKISENREKLISLLEQLNFASEIKPKVPPNVPVTLVIFGTFQYSDLALRRFEYAKQLIHLDNPVQHVFILGGERNLWPTEPYLATYLHKNYYTDETEGSINQKINDKYDEISETATSKAEARQMLVEKFLSEYPGWHWPTEHDLMLHLAEQCFSEEINRKVTFINASAVTRDGISKRPTTLSTLQTLKEHNDMVQINNSQLIFISSQPHVQSQQADVLSVFGPDYKNSAVGPAASLVTALDVQEAILALVGGIYSRTNAHFSAANDEQVEPNTQMKP